MNKIIDYAAFELKKSSFDSLAVGIIDFQSNSFESFCFYENEQIADKQVYFDLASITKPLTLASSFLIHEDVFDQNMNLLLNHKAGLPTHGRLSKSTWKKQINNYSIGLSPTAYSDYSALKTMLELEKKLERPLLEICGIYFDDELRYWKDLDLDQKIVITGERFNNAICGQVHDDNAYVINERVSHAGLFSTIDGLCKSVLNLNHNYGLLRNMQSSYDLGISDRFINGWDRVENQSTTLAGSKASLKTFGHLGFTGTSLWIDLEKKRGSVILSNGTRNFWYDKTHLNEMRRNIGNLIWDH